MTQGQFESVSAEVLSGATPAGQVESVSAEALAAGPSGLVIESVWVEVLAAQVTEAQIETVWAEVLVPSPKVGGNIFDSTGLEHEVFQWDGAALTPMTFVP